MRIDKTNQWQGMPPGSEPENGKRTARIRSKENSDAGPNSTAGTDQEDRRGKENQATPSPEDEVLIRDTTAIRANKIAHARELMKTGGYNTPEVIDEIIKRLMESLKEG